MQYFYGTYISDRKLRSLFDLARLIVEPDYARKSHITLRGPYKRKPSNKKWVGRNVGMICLSKPDHFLIEDQNTVYIRAVLLDLRELWWKKDFPQGTPHLSIYDGDDRRFAWQVFNSLKKFKWNIYVEFSPVSIIEKKHDYEQNFFLKIDDIDLLFTSISENPMTVDRIKKMHPGQRIYQLEKICTEIHRLSASQNSTSYGR